MRLRGHHALDWFNLLSWLSVAALLLTTQASAELMNVTVDDEYSDPLTLSQNVVYRGSWRSASQSCDDCVVGLDVWRAYLSTWHESIYPPSATQPNTASLTFEGVGVYVFCIIAGDANMRFVLDGRSVGQYSHALSNPTAYAYNVLVYSNSTLPAGQHTIQIQNGSPGNQSLALLDYIVYTRGTAVESSASQIVTTFTAVASSATVSPPTPFERPRSSFAAVSIATPIAIVGALVLTAIVGFSLKYGKRFLRKREQRRRPPSAQWLQTVGAAATPSGGGGGGGGGPRFVSSSGVSGAGVTHSPSPAEVRTGAGPSHAGPSSLSKSLSH
ncbi:hypothetical protein C8Q74DRAFT_1220516 [Fomes fomentarius]|nr:hypothetical protein C8Q74DRAFT_1220516 [Fomes fomentarius]